MESTTYSYTLLFCSGGEGSRGITFGLTFFGWTARKWTLPPFPLRSIRALKPKLLTQLSSPLKGQTNPGSGICYIVFENMDLAPYSNRIPQVTAELIAPIETSRSGRHLQYRPAFSPYSGSGEFCLWHRGLYPSNATSSVPNNFFPNGLLRMLVWRTPSICPRAAETVCPPSS